MPRERFIISLDRIWKTWTVQGKSGQVATLATSLVIWLLSKCPHTNVDLLKRTLSDLNSRMEQTTRKYQQTDRHAQKLTLGHTNDLLSAMPISNWHAVRQSRIRMMSEYSRMKSLWHHRSQSTGISSEAGLKPISNHTDKQTEAGK